MDEEDEEEVRGNTVAEFRWLSQLDDDSTTKKICSTTVSEMIDKDVWINITYNCLGYRIIYIELIPLVQPAPYLLRGISSKVKVKERSGLRAPAVFVLDFGMKAEADIRCDCITWAPLWIGWIR